MNFIIIFSLFVKEHRSPVNMILKKTNPINNLLNFTPMFQFFLGKSF